MTFKTHVLCRQHPNRFIKKYWKTSDNRCVRLYKKIHLCDLNLGRLVWKYFSTVHRFCEYKYLRYSSAYFLHNFNIKHTLKMYPNYCNKPSSGVFLTSKEITLNTSLSVLQTLNLKHFGGMSRNFKRNILCEMSPFIGRLQHHYKRKKNWN